MNVLVTGGTGTVGRHVVSLLRQSGHRARIFSRHPRGHVDAVRGDLKTGARESLAGRSDIKATRRLVDVARDRGIRNFVYTSIVGMEGVAFPYYRPKLAVEGIVKQDLVPWSILRATQFHELMETFLRGFSRVPGMMVIPFGWRFQPVEAREVVQRLVEVTLHGPQGMLQDFGSPEVRDFKSIAESWLRATGHRRRLVNLRLPVKFSRDLSAGKLLASDHTDGKVTFDQYLAEKYPLAK